MSPSGEWSLVVTNETIVRSADPRSKAVVGWATIGLGVLSNLPFMVLTARFDYPAILRQPAANVLEAFAEGGGGLIAAWYGYGLSALALVPLSLAIAFVASNRNDQSGFAIGSAIVGSLAGVTQAIGLLRWVFVIPHLTRAATDPYATAATRAAAASAFDLMNLFGGVTIGEHVGQSLTCLWVLLVAIIQWRGGRTVDRTAAVLGGLTVTGIGFGLGEGLSIALGLDGSLFGMGTTLGFIGLTLWLIATGVALILPRKNH